MLETTAPQRSAAGSVGAIINENNMRPEFHLFRHAIERRQDLFASVPIIVDRHHDDDLLLECWIV